MFERMFVEFILDRFRPGWRERKARQKSLWHLPKLVVAAAFLGASYFLLFKLMWQVHLLFHPDHLGRLGELWPKRVGFLPFVTVSLLVLPPALPAIGLSAVLTNLVFWCIGPARRAFEREAEGDPEMTFRGTTAKLAKITLTYFLPIGLGLSLIGAGTLNELQ